MLYDTQVARRRAQEVSEDEIRSLMESMNVLFQQALQQLRERREVRECEAGFRSWRSAYSLLQAADPFSARSHLVSSVDFYLLDWELHRYRHNAEYGAEGNFVAAKGFTMALNMLIRSGGLVL
jgi:hypothetical protein